MEGQHIDHKARSPWTPLQEVASITISPSGRELDGVLTIPGSKSLTNRALIISALAGGGTSRLTGILKSDDTYWCIEALKRLGVKIAAEDETAVIEGLGGRWNLGSLYIGAAGTIARFLPGVLAAANGGTWEIEASKSMSKRPVAPLVDALRELGADIEYLGEKGYYPLRITGSGVEGGEVSISGAISSQFISGLLIAAPFFKKTTTIRVTDSIVQHAYVHLTLDLMKKFGADVAYDSDLKKIVVQPSRYVPQEIVLEADASTACYFLALAAVNSGRICIDNLTYETKQPDIKMLDVFEKMGCKVTRGATFIEIEGAAQLRGGFELSMREMSDQALTLVAIAPSADGPITIKDVAHIRHHECDRIQAICKSLKAVGIRVEEYDDGLKVYPGAPKPAAFLPTYDDHRVAMSLALIGTRVEGIQLHDPGCVSKTCPQYFEQLKMGAEIAW